MSDSFFVEDTGTATPPTGPIPRSGQSSGKLLSEDISSAEDVVSGGRTVRWPYVAGAKSVSAMLHFFAGGRTRFASLLPMETLSGVSRSGEYGPSTSSLEELETRARTWGLLTYLSNLVSQGLVALETRVAAWRAWGRLTEVFFGSLPIPDASPGPNGEILYTWDRAEHHAELEFMPGRFPMLFYMNRITGEAEEHKFNEADVSRLVRDRLRLFR